MKWFRRGLLCFCLLALELSYNYGILRVACNAQQPLVVRANDLPFGLRQFLGLLVIEPVLVHEVGYGRPARPVHPWSYGPRCPYMYPCPCPPAAAPAGARGKTEGPPRSRRGRPRSLVGFS